MSYLSEVNPYPVTNGDKTNLRIQVCEDQLREITVASDVSPDVIRLVKRGSMFPYMLTAMVLAEQALYRAATQGGALYPEDVIDAKEAHKTIKAVGEIILARGLKDNAEQSAAMKQLREQSPVQRLIRACGAIVPLLDSAEFHQGPEVIAQFDEFRLALEPFQEVSA